MNEREEYRLKRLQKRIKIVDVAKKLDRSPSTISKYESGYLNFPKYVWFKYKQIIDNWEGDR